MTGIGLNGISPTSAQLGVYGYEANAAQIELQYGERFDRGIAPLPKFAVGNINLQGLNQYSRYQIRARSVLPDDSRGEWSNELKIFTPLQTARILTPQAISIDAAMVVVPEDTVWTCQTEEPGHPAAALGVDAPAYALWARKAGTGFAIEGMHAGSPIDTIALLGTNASEACTVTIYAGFSVENIRSAQPSYVYGPVPFRASPNLEGRANGYHFLGRLGAPVTMPFWRIVITGTVPGDLLVATHAVLGLNRPTRNLSAGQSETTQDASSLTRDRSGAPSRVDGYRSRLVDFDMSLLTYAQFEMNYRGLRNRIGLTDPALVVPNSKKDAYLHDRILYGAITASSVALPYSQRFNQSFAVDSII